MKRFLLFIGISLLIPAIPGNSQPIDSLENSFAISYQVCPRLLQESLNQDSLEYSAAIFFINDSSHPLGKLELKDYGKPVRYLNVPIRMKRITLLYVKPGRHQFNTIYMKKYEELNIKPGEIYIAMLITTSVWPVPYAFIKEDRFGREYVPVLLLYISVSEAEQLLEKIKNKEVIVNPAR